MPVLKKVMRGRSKEARFRVMVNEEVTIPNIDRAVRKWDIEEYLANDKRKSREVDRRQKKEEHPQQSWKSPTLRGQAPKNEGKTVATPRTSPDPP